MLYSKRSARIILFAIGAGVFASPQIFYGLSPWGCVYRVSDVRPLDVLVERTEAPESKRVEQEEVGTLRTWWAGEMTVLGPEPEVSVGPATNLDERVEVRRVLEHRLAPDR